jgi:hypothetical protein
LCSQELLHRRIHLTLLSSDTRRPLVLWCGSRPSVHHVSVRIMRFRY